MKQLWNSRFVDDVADQTLHYTETTEIDKRFIRHDLWGSIVHVLMLARASLISEADAQAILNVLLELLDEERNGNVALEIKHEDVHLNIEARVIAKLGLEIGGRMHTARSRNDQVVTDLRLYLREKLLDAYAGTIDLIDEILLRAQKDIDAVMVGYTHSQAAQPLTFGFWLSGYASILLRDCSRLQSAFRATNLSPLGACALAGTSFNIDRQYTSDLLGFDGLIEHALDATSSRDFAIETAAALSFVMLTISRLCEELVWWSSLEYGLLDVGDAFSTGSSIMPQKRNPVVAELARARPAVVFGALTEMLTLVKALPLGYTCDLQQDKPPLWRIFDVTLPTLSIMQSQISALRVNRDRTLNVLFAGFTTATELANEIVRKFNISFRDAYSLTGNIVKELSKNGKDFREVAAVQRYLRQAGYDIAAGDLQNIVDPAEAVRRQVSTGSTNPDSVRSMIAKFEHMLAEHSAFVAGQRERIHNAMENSIGLAQQKAQAISVSER
jgi:argininosuccinate lyase